MQQGKEAAKEMGVNREAIPTAGNLHFMLLGTARARAGLSPLGRASPRRRSPPSTSRPPLTRTEALRQGNDHRRRVAGAGTLKVSQHHKNNERLWAGTNEGISFNYLSGSLCKSS